LQGERQALAEAAQRQGTSLQVAVDRLAAVQVMLKRADELSQQEFGLEELARP